MNSNIGAVLGEQEVVGLRCLPRNVFSGGMSPSLAATGVENGSNDIFANAGGGGEQPLDATRGAGRAAAAGPPDGQKLLEEPKSEGVGPGVFSPPCLCVVPPVTFVPNVRPAPILCVQGGVLSRSRRRSFPCRKGPKIVRS